jgi:hypothetical protein
MQTVTVNLIPSSAKDVTNQRELPNTKNNFLIDLKAQDKLRSINRFSAQCKAGADVVRRHINCGVRVYR